jgi:hypothetical protein
MAKYIIKRREFVGLNNAYSPSRQQSFSAWRTVAKHETAAEARADFDSRQCGLDQFSIWYRGELLDQRPR